MNRTWRMAGPLFGGRFWGRCNHSFINTCKDHSWVVDQWNPVTRKIACALNAFLAANGHFPTHNSSLVLGKEFEDHGRGGIKQDAYRFYALISTTGLWRLSVLHRYTVTNSLDVNAARHVVLVWYSDAWLAYACTNACYMISLSLMLTFWQGSVDVLSVASFKISYHGCLVAYLNLSYVIWKFLSRCVWAKNRLSFPELFGI